MRYAKVAFYIGVSAGGAELFVMPDERCIIISCCLRVSIAPRCTRVITCTRRRPLYTYIVYVLFERHACMFNYRQIPYEEMPVKGIVIELLRRVDERNYIFTDAMRAALSNKTVVVTSSFLR